jgi:hypothetical protein
MSMVIALAQIVVVAAALAEPQSPIAPVRIDPPAGGGNPIVISVTGVEQDPIPLTARWSASDACLADIACFVSSWIEANSTGNLDHVLALRAPTERADVQSRYKDPSLMARNVSRFNAVRKWGLLGWANYGTFRIVFLTRDDERSQSVIYTLPLKQVDGKWMQTDALAADSGVYEMFDRIGKAILERHKKQ